MLLIVPVVSALCGSAVGHGRAGEHPVLNNEGLLLGGLIDGRWAGWEEVGGRLNGKETYRHYGDRAFLSKGRGAKPIQQFFITGQFLYWVDTGRHSGRRLSIAGDWNPWPRRVVSLKKGLEKYAPFIKPILVNNGLTKTSVCVNQAIQADLDGDGTVETLLAASNVPGLTAKEMDAVTAGTFKGRSRCYSVVLLVRKGKTAQVVAQSLGELAEHEIDFVADVNNDGTLEFLVRELWIESLAAEGFSFISDYLYRPDKRKTSPISHIEYHPFIPGESL